jgi:hypothetical protein
MPLFAQTNKEIKTAFEDSVKKYEALVSYDSVSTYLDSSLIANGVSVFTDSTDSEYVQLDFANLASELASGSDLFAIKWWFGVKSEFMSDGAIETALTQRIRINWRRAISGLERMKPYFQ